MADIFRHPDLLYTTDVFLPSALGIKLNIKRDCRDPPALVERGQLNERPSQHRELLTREVGRGGPLSSTLRQLTLWRKQEPRRCNVYPNPPTTLRQ